MQADRSTLPGLFFWFSLGIQLLAVVTIRFELEWVGMTLAMADEPWNYKALPALVVAFWPVYALGWQTLLICRSYWALPVPLLWWLLEAMLLAAALANLDGPYFTPAVEAALPQLQNEKQWARNWLMLISLILALKLLQGPLVWLAFRRARRG